MLIGSALELPAVLRRSLEAYRAGDALKIADAFDQHASLKMVIDSKLANRLGLHVPLEPIRANGAVGIMQLYALEFATFDVTGLEVLSTMQVGRDVAAVCEWSVKLRGSGAEFTGRCHNIWTMDHTGRKLVDARSVCKIVTPSWDHGIN